MRLKKVLFASLLFATVATAAPSTRPAHDREPFIFRCVLDENARMVVISLGNNVWAAYDASRCTLTKIWIGDVEFTGPVFDTRHGPQPKSRGTMLFDRPTPVEPTAAGATTRPIDAQIAGYRGYTIDGDRATLNFDFNGITIGETLAVTDIDVDAKTVTVRRTIVVGGTLSTDRAIALETPGANAVRMTKLVDGELAVNDAGSPLNAPAELPTKPEANLRFNVTKPGTIVIETTFSTAGN